MWGPHICIVLNWPHGLSSVRIAVQNLVPTKSDSFLQWNLSSLMYCYKWWTYLVCHFTYFKYLKWIISGYKNNSVFDSCRTTIFFLICDILVSFHPFGNRFFYLFIVCNLFHISFVRTDWWQYSNKSQRQKVLFLH
jgi:hypothetical protein